MKRARTTKGGTVTANRSAPATTVMEWVDQQMADPRRRVDIEALLDEMRIEQDLIALREARKLSQRELAERAGVKQPMIARIESGRARNIEIRTLLRLATALGARVTVKITKDPHWDGAVTMRRAVKRAG